MVVVTSGAIAAGWAALDRGEQRPSDPAVLQAVSAVGQHRLMRLWQDGLEPHGLLAGQVLLAPLDFVHRTQYLHARGTLRHLVDLGVVPIVNENDAVADEEIRFGDNDRLAALVAHLVGAQLLVLLTDAPGLLTADPRRDAEASLIEEVVEIDQQLERLAGGPGSAVGSGGMASKLAAAKIATWSGVRDRDRGCRRGPACWPPRWPGSRAWGRCSGPASAGSRPASCGSPSRSGSSGSLTVDDGRAGGADRSGPLAPGGRRTWVPAAPSARRTPSRSPVPTAGCSPRAWSASTPSGRGSGWAGAARSSSTGTTWSSLPDPTGACNLTR